MVVKKLFADVVVVEKPSVLNRFELDSSKKNTKSPKKDGSSVASSLLLLLSSHHSQIATSFRCFGCFDFDCYYCLQRFEQAMLAV